MAPRYTRWEETVDIPEFHGGTYSDSLLYWFEDVEEILEFQNVSEKRLVSLVVEKFRGQAQSWWRQVKMTRERAGKSPIKSWDKLKQKLCATFLPHHMMYKRLPNPVRHGGNKREKKQPRVQHENKDVTTDFTNVVSALTDPIFLNNWKLMINQREEPIKVPREDGDHVVIVENPSPEEEVEEEEEEEEEEEVSVVKNAEQKDIQDDHNLLIKEDVSLLNGSSTLEETIIPEGVLVIQHVSKEVVSVAQDKNMFLHHALPNIKLQCGVSNWSIGAVFPRLDPCYIFTTVICGGDVACEPRKLMTCELQGVCQRAVMAFVFSASQYKATHIRRRDLVFEPGDNSVKGTEDLVVTRVQGSLEATFFLTDTLYGESNSKLHLRWKKKCHEARKRKHYELIEKGFFNVKHYGSDSWANKCCNGEDNNLEEGPKILFDFKELSSDGYLHDFPPMRDKVDEVLHQ